MTAIPEPRPPSQYAYYNGIALLNFLPGQLYVVDTISPKSEGYVRLSIPGRPMTASTLVREADVDIVTSDLFDYWTRSSNEASLAQHARVSTDRDLVDLVNYLEYGRTSGERAAREDRAQEEVWANKLRELILWAQKHGRTFSK